MAHDVYYTLLEHFKKRGIEVPNCPICGQKNWSVQSLIAPDFFQERPLLGIAHMLNPETKRTQLTPTGQRGPLVPMLCQNCYFVYHFAWVPIVQESGDGQ
jgi:ribosomal protein L34E